MASTSKDYFESSFGKKIQFLPGYLEYLKNTVGLREKPAWDHVNASINVVGGHENMDFDAVGQKAANRAKPHTSVTLFGFGIRLARTEILLDMLQHAGVDHDFRKAIDIGCGFGIQPRLLRAFGVARHVTGIDIIDRCSAIDERHLRRQYRAIKALSLLERYQERLLRKPLEQRSKFQRALVDKLPGPRLATRSGVGFMPSRDMYRRRFVAPPTVDEFIEGNVFKLEEKFDLVTSFGSLQWFEVDKILSKAHALLEDGGIFFFWTANWWTEVNFAGLVGHFPFAAQRLNREDYFRYLDEFLPDNAEAFKAAYNFFTPTHPTLADWIDAAHRTGFEPLGFRTYTRAETYSKKYGLHSRAHALDNPKVFDEVLSDINQFRPDVRLQDLHPYSFAVVLKKVDQKRSMDENRLAEADRTFNYSYEPSSWLGKVGKQVANKLILSR